MDEAIVLLAHEFPLKKALSFGKGFRPGSIF
jgi:hypothetical protein